MDPLAFAVWNIHNSQSFQMGNEYLSKGLIKLFTYHLKLKLYHVTLPRTIQVREKIKTAYVKGREIDGGYSFRFFNFNFCSLFWRKVLILLWNFC